jgi:phage FluMu protein Com
MVHGIYCWQCGSELGWAGYASMGGSHSNYYKCAKCKKVVEIYDRVLGECVFYDVRKSIIYDNKGCHAKRKVSKPNPERGKHE